MTLFSLWGLGGLVDREDVLMLFECLGQTQILPSEAGLLKTIKTYLSDAKKLYCNVSGPNCSNPYANNGSENSAMTLIFWSFPSIFSSKSVILPSTDNIGPMIIIILTNFSYNQEFSFSTKLKMNPYIYLYTPAKYDHFGNLLSQ